MTIASKKGASFTAEANGEQVEMAYIRDDGAVCIDAFLLDSVAGGFYFNNAEVIVDVLRGLARTYHDSKH